jgi:benzoylformate decarboxylase
LLKLNIQEYWRERQIPKHAFPASFDVSQPELRFDLLAEAMGVRAMRVEKPEQIEAALQQALADDQPFLIDLVVSSEIPVQHKEKVLHVSSIS